MFIHGVLFLTPQDLAQGLMYLLYNPNYEGYLNSDVNDHTIHEAQVRRALLGLRCDPIGHDR